jgi:hypothetical protein
MPTSKQTQFNFLNCFSEMLMIDNKCVFFKVFCNTNNVPGRGSGQSYGRKRRDSPAGFALNKPAWLSLSSSSSSSTMKPIEDTNEEELVMEMLRVNFQYLK